MKPTIAPQAATRFVVSLPPEPSRLGERLRRAAGASYTTLTATHEAFLHLAGRARDRLVVMTPFIDASGAGWASELFEATPAPRRELILRGASQLAQCGSAGTRLQAAITRLLDYSFAPDEQWPSLETFHAKIVLADGVAAYVGSANFLYRSREANLECGVLFEGDAVASVAVLVDAVLSIFPD